VTNDESGESMELMGGVLAARVRIAAAAPLRITLSMSTESMRNYAYVNMLVGSTLAQPRSANTAFVGEWLAVDYYYCKKNLAV